MLPPPENSQARGGSKFRDFPAPRKHPTDPGRNSANFPGTGENMRTIPGVMDYLSSQKAAQSGRKRVKNKNVEIAGPFVFIGSQPPYGDWG
jgi:hypothetical protein